VNIMFSGHQTKGSLLIADHLWARRSCWKARRAPRCGASERRHGAGFVERCRAIACVQRAKRAQEVARSTFRCKKVARGPRRLYR
jgi:hypothetical protein